MDDDHVRVRLQRPHAFAVGADNVTDFAVTVRGQRGPIIELPLAPTGSASARRADPLVAVATYVHSFLPRLSYPVARFTLLSCVCARIEKVELLERIPLFANCSKRELDAIGGIADEIDLREGKELTREGRPGREFFVLVDGTADVVKNERKVNTLKAATSSGRSRSFTTRRGQPRSGRPRPCGRS